MHGEGRGLIARQHKWLHWEYLDGSLSRTHVSTLVSWIAFGTGLVCKWLTARALVAGSGKPLLMSKLYCRSSESFSEENTGDLN